MLQGSWWNVSIHSLRSATLPPTSFKLFSCCCSWMIYCHWTLFVCTQCVWVATVSSQKWYGHNRCRSWIRGLKPPRLADLFTRCYGLFSTMWRHHEEIPHTIMSATLTLPALCELSTWTRWPRQIKKTLDKEGGGKMKEKSNQVYRSIHTWHSLEIFNLKWSTKRPHMFCSWILISINQCFAESALGTSDVRDISSQTRN